MKTRLCCTGLLLLAATAAGASAQADSATMPPEGPVPATSALPLVVGALKTGERVRVAFGGRLVEAQSIGAAARDTLLVRDGDVTTAIARVAAAVHT